MRKFSTQFVHIELRELNQEPRSPNRMLEVTLKNFYVEPLGLMAVEVFVPEGAALQELKSKSATNLLHQINTLKREIDVHLSDAIFFASKDVRERRSKIVIDLIRESLRGDLSTLRGVLIFCFSLLFRPLWQYAIVQRFIKLYEGDLVRVEDSQNAKSVLASIGAPERESESAHNVIRLKIRQLETIEKEYLIVLSDGTLTMIDSGESHREHFYLSFTPSALSRRLFNIVLEFRFKAMEQNNEDSIKIAHTFSIPPSGAVLSALAFISGIGAFVLKSSSQGVIDQSFSQIDVLTSLPAVFFAGFVGFLFFNIFDQIDVRAFRRFGISWRSAILVGFVAGYFSDNIFSRIQGFFGIS